MEERMICPICNHELAQCRGTQLDPNDGITVWCPSHECPSQEVAGHGRNAEQAYNIVREKYKPETK